VHLVTVLEEMPVQETSDGIEDLHRANLPVGAVLVNLVRSNELDEDARNRAVAGRLPREAIGSDLAAFGIDP
jgi:hypothetical protein